MNGGLVAGMVIPLHRGRLHCGGVLVLTVTTVAERLSRPDAAGLVASPDRRAELRAEEQAVNERLQRLSALLVLGQFDEPDVIAVREAGRARLAEVRASIASVAQASAGGAAAASRFGAPRLGRLHR